MELLLDRTNYFNRFLNDFLYDKILALGRGVSSFFLSCVSETAK